MTIGLTQEGIRTGQDTMDSSIPVVIASDQGDLSVKPFQPVIELNVTELIGIDEQVAQWEYSGSVAVNLGTATSGVLLGVALYATETGTGQIISEDGILLVLDANPSVSPGDTHLVSGEWATIIGVVSISEDDWFEENAATTGAVIFYPCKPIAFHAISNLYFVYYHQGATSWNDVAGDDEILQLNGWIRVDSKS